jgi:hypothetical protein
MAQEILVENYCCIDGPQDKLTLLRSKSFCPKVWFGLTPFETTVTLSRHSLGPGQGQYLDARFKSRDTTQVLNFYSRLASAFPEVRITYEYFAPGVAVHGTAPMQPSKHYFGSEQELIAIRAIRQWKLPLTVVPKQLTSCTVNNVSVEPIYTFKYDDEGDCIMICV